jgi:hypothetical protein
MDRRPAQALACLLLALPLLAEEAKPLHAHWAFHSDITACADPTRPDKRWAPAAIPAATPGCYRKRFTLTAGTRFALVFDGPAPTEIFLNGQPLAAPYEFTVSLNTENLLAIIAPAGLAIPLRLVKDPAPRPPAPQAKPGALRLAASPGPLPADRTGFAVITANQSGPLHWSVRGQGDLAGPASFGSVNLIRTTGTAGKITVTATTPAGETASVDLWSTAVPLGNSWMREPSR